MSGGVGDGGGAAEAPWIEVTGSPHFAGWLAEQRVSLAFTKDDRHYRHDRNGSPRLYPTQALPQ
jgi:hypothetical protein